MNLGIKKTSTLKVCLDSLGMGRIDGKLLCPPEKRKESGQRTEEAGRRRGGS